MRSINHEQLHHWKVGIYVVIIHYEILMFMNVEFISDRESHSERTIFSFFHKHCSKIC